LIEIPVRQASKCASHASVSVAVTWVALGDLVSDWSGVCRGDSWIAPTMCSMQPRTAILWVKHRVLHLR
jgi:hypothetical protein